MKLLRFSVGCSNKKLKSKKEWPLREMNAHTQLKVAEISIFFWTKLASFGHLGHIRDPVISFKNSRSRNYAIVKWETFTTARRHVHQGHVVQN